MSSDLKKFNANLLLNLYRNSGKFEKLIDNTIRQPPLTNKSVFAMANVFSSQETPLEELSSPSVISIKGFGITSVSNDFEVSQYFETLFKEQSKSMIKDTLFQNRDLIRKVNEAIKLLETADLNAITETTGSNLLKYYYMFFVGSIGARPRVRLIVKSKEDAAFLTFLSLVNGNGNASQARNNFWKGLSSAYFPTDQKVSRTRGFFSSNRVLEYVRLLRRTRNIFSAQVSYLSKLTLDTSNNGYTISQNIADVLQQTEELWKRIIPGLGTIEENELGNPQSTAFAASNLDKKASLLSALVSKMIRVYNTSKSYSSVESPLDEQSRRNIYIRSKKLVSLQEKLEEIKNAPPYVGKREEILNLENDIQSSKDGIFKLYGDQLDRLITSSSLSERQRQELLNIHAVLSFFFFNKDMFFTKKSLKEKPEDIRSLIDNHVAQISKDFEVVFGLAAVGNMAEQRDDLMSLYKFNRDTLEKILSDLKEIKGSSPVTFKKRMKVFHSQLSKMSRSSAIEGRFEERSRQKLLDLSNRVNESIQAIDFAIENPGIIADATGMKPSQVSVIALDDVSDFGFSNKKDILRESSYLTMTELSKRLEENAIPDYVVNSFKESVSKGFQEKFDAFSKDENSSALSLYTHTFDPENAVALNEQRKKTDRLLSQIKTFGRASGYPIYLDNHYFKRIAAGLGLSQSKVSGMKFNKIGKQTVSKGETLKDIRNALLYMRNKHGLTFAILDHGKLSEKTGKRLFPEDKMRQGVKILYYYNAIKLQEDGRRRLQTVAITENSDGFIASSGGVFAPVFQNKSMFKYYRQRKEENSPAVIKANEDLKWVLFREFLPILIQGFLSKNRIESIFDPRADSFVNKLAEVFPDGDVRGTFESMQALHRSQDKKLQELKVYFQQGFDRSNFKQEGLYEFFLLAKDAVGGGFRDQQERSVAASAGLMIGTLVAAALPFSFGWIGTAIFAAGVASFAYLEKDDIKKRLKQLLNRLIDFRSQILPTSPQDDVNSYLIEMLSGSIKYEVAISAETSNMQGVKRLPSEAMAHTLFLQEIFSALEQMPLDLSAFDRRVNRMLPQGNFSQAELSVLILNAFTLANKNLTDFLPPEFLRLSGSRYWEKGVKDLTGPYTRKWNDAVDNPESLSSSEDVINLTLSGTNLLARTSFRPMRKVALKELNPKDPKSFSDSINGIQSLHRKIDFNFLSAQRSALTQNLSSESSMILALSKQKNDLTEKDKSFFIKSLKSSFGLLTYGVVLSQQLEDFANGLTLKDLSSTYVTMLNEKPISPLNSPAFQNPLDLIQNTIQIAEILAKSSIASVPTDISNVRKLRILNAGAIAVAKLKLAAANRIQGKRTIRTYMLTELEKTKEALKTILYDVGEGEDVLPILLPVMYSNEVSTNSQLPLGLWLSFEAAYKLDFDQDLTAQLKTLVSQGRLVSNLFSSQATRGAALTPFVLNALDDAFAKEKSFKTVEFLGIESQSQRDVMKSQREEIAPQTQIKNKIYSVASNFSSQLGMGQGVSSSGAALLPSRTPPPQSSPQNQSEFQRLSENNQPPIQNQQFQPPQSINPVQQQPSQSQGMGVPAQGSVLMGQGLGAPQNQGNPSPIAQQSQQSLNVEPENQPIPLFFPMQQNQQAISPQNEPITQNKVAQPISAEPQPQAQQNAVENQQGIAIGNQGQNFSMSSSIGSPEENPWARRNVSPEENEYFSVKNRLDRRYADEPIDPELARRLGPAPQRPYMGYSTAERFSRFSPRRSTPFQKKVAGGILGAATVAGILAAALSNNKDDDED